MIFAQGEATPKGWSGMSSRGKFCVAALAVAIVAASGTAWAASFIPVVTGLANPTGVATDASGNLFIADFGGHAVYESLAPGYGTKTVLAGGPFGSPFGIAVDRHGNVFVTDDSDESVKEIPAPGYTTVITLASGFTGLNGLAVDANDNIFVVDSAATKIFELKASNYANKVVIGNVAAPFGVAVDAAANVFVTVDTNQSANILEFFAATGYQGVTIYGQPVADPQGIAVDAQGNLFFSSVGGGVFKAANVGGSLVVTGVAGGFQDPLGVALDSQGNIFVAGGSAGVIDEIGGTPLPVPALAPGGLALLSLLLGGAGWWALRGRRTRLS